MAGVLLHSVQRIVTFVLWRNYATSPVPGTGRRVKQMHPVPAKSRYLQLFLKGTSQTVHFEMSRGKYVLLVCYLEKLNRSKIIHLLVYYLCPWHILLNSHMGGNGCDDINVVQWYQISELSKDKFPLYVITFIALLKILHTEAGWQDWRTTQEEDSPTI